MTHPHSDKGGSGAAPVLALVVGGVLILTGTVWFFSSLTASVESWTAKMERPSDVEATDTRPERTVPEPEAPEPSLHRSLPASDPAPAEIPTVREDRSADQVAALPEPDPQQQLVRAIQTELQRLGYYTDDIDGSLGRRTIMAIQTYEIVSDRDITGQPSEELLADLRLETRTIDDD